MAAQLVECVPNFSEGRDQVVIEAIAGAIRQVAGVELLDVDPGAATHRTVITFVAPPAAVVEAALAGMRKAAELIDMRHHRGEHPRQGATDVCPLIPLSGVTEAECVALARELGARAGAELDLPIYLYGAAATCPERVALADLRRGEYEALAEKLTRPEWRPDFGPAEFNPRLGATVVGVRPFLLAYNINLNSQDPRIAREIAQEIRESGRPVRDDQGRIVRDAAGQPIQKPTPHTLQACRATGWYIEEYGCAQVTMNLTDHRVTSLHHAFDVVCRLAETRGVRVTGSEVVGLVPREPLLAAGRHYLIRQGAFAGVADATLIRCAIRSLGLNDVAPFDPRQKIIEERVGRPPERLVSMNLREWSEAVASDAPAPGGGSVAALAGTMAASLTAMVAALTHGKARAEQHAQLQEVGRLAHHLREQLLTAVDQDTAAFSAVMAAIRMPRSTSLEQAARTTALRQAYETAIRVPLEVLRSTAAVLDLTQIMVSLGQASTKSDVAVAVAMAAAAAEGAYSNVLINLAEVDDPAWREEVLRGAQQVLDSVTERAADLRQLILRQLRDRWP